uniref:Uncharacterized protein n=1 Tax=Podoviridae sp. ctlpi2 TaxID=2826574 RepID=A0A8S5MLC2_9CAUD|nr:MAG TPA: hypothetical protein [Podoviridae sp. ctlpi2]
MHGLRAVAPCQRVTFTTGKTPALACGLAHHLQDSGPTVNGMTRHIISICLACR